MIGQDIREDGNRTVRHSSLAVRARVLTVRRSLTVLALFSILPLMAAPAPVQAQESELASQLQRVRRDLSDLQAYIYSGKAPSREAIAEINAQGGGGSTARLQVQIQNIESQIRTLTGRIEEIEYRINRVTDRVEKLVADIDVRFQALESGNGGGSAVPEAGGSPRAEQPRPAEGTQVASTAGQAVPERTPEGLEVGQQVLGTMSQSGGATAVKPTLKSVPEEANGRVGTPEPSQVASAASTPRERYDAAFAFLRQKQYDKAANAFDSFVKENPDSPLSSNALYWLGETHYFRKDYAEAAKVFLDGYKRYPKGSKAPDNLFKLGKSLAAIDEKKPACAALNKLLKSYPDANRRLLGNAKSEMGKLNCS
jgi:tol-pal system protein YbgF